MDILHLIDQLEELFNDSKSLWITNDVLIKEERLLDLIDQMRLSIPDEIKKAKQIINQKERILAQTNEEASRTLELAKEKSTELVERDGIVQSAEAKAEQILRMAEEKSKMVMHDADEYVIASLHNLKLELEKIISQVSNGIRVLDRDVISQPESKTQFSQEYKDISKTSSK